MNKAKKIVKYLMDSDYRFFINANRGKYDNLSDEEYLKKYYRARMKKELNLENPQTFNEKLQWLKLYDRKPEYTTMVDKYEVKQYVADKIGEQYIIPTLGVWDAFEEIDFENLPNQFVLKCTHDSGGIAICRDKSVFDIDKAKNIINKSLKNNYYYHGREWPYKNVKPRILAEQYMEDDESQELSDYKFYCFNGEPKFLYLSKGLECHATAKISYVTLDWELAEFKRVDFKPFDTLPPKPLNFEKMQELACKLSAEIPFLRVDFYEVNGQIYFSELTFFPGSGYTKFEPEVFDVILGTELKLPK